MPLPRDPLIDTAVMVDAAAQLTCAHPDLAFVGSGYSYFQQWLGHVAQHQVRTGAITSVGIGRNMLSYPWMPADLLAGEPSCAPGWCAAPSATAPPAPATG
jgi:NADPH2 dehydrogenase